MKKIKIRRVDEEIKKRKGLFDGGCKTARCNDDCCMWGCDVDASSLKLILKHKGVIEPLIGRTVEECFSTPVKRDNDYVGGAYRETLVRKEDGRCAFHLAGKRGCSLFIAWAKHGAPKMTVPTICRIYPVTWHRGKLFADSPIKKLCKCMEKTPRGEKVPSMFETQKKEILALFEIAEKTKKRLTD